MKEEKQRQIRNKVSNAPIKNSLEGERPSQFDLHPIYNIYPRGIIGCN